MARKNKLKKLKSKVLNNRETQHEDNITAEDQEKRLSEEDAEEGYVSAESADSQSVEVPHGKRTLVSEETHAVKRAKVDYSSELLKPPTAEELDSIRETQALHHSNIFRMQMEELLKEMSCKEKHLYKLHKWKKDFEKYVKSLEKSQQFQFKHKEWIQEHKLTVPLPNYSSWPEVTGMFEFHPPEDVTFVGSLSAQLITTHSPVVDIALILPKGFMQHNDLQNCHWLLRRALYLSWVGKALKENSDLVANLSWTYHCGSHLRPVLQVTPSGKLGHRWKINLFPIPPENYFNISHISPLRNNVSLSWYFSKEKQAGDTVIPTPHYNWAVGVDVVMLQHNKYISENLHHSNWIEGTKLLNLWLSQRYLNRCEGGMSSHVIVLLVIYLIQNRKIILQMSPYQVFRTVLLYITQNDWAKSGLSLAAKRKPKDRNEILLTVEDFHRFYNLVFIDPTGYLNLVAHTFHQTFLEVQYEAKKALEILENSLTNSFEALFIQKVEFYLNYDQILKIDLQVDDIFRIFSENETDIEGALLDFIGDRRLTVFSKIVAVLKKAFSDRLNSMGFFKVQAPVWSFDKNPQVLRRSVTLGLLLNPVTSVSLLTKGPFADTDEAKEFREFWGDLSSMRRFQDSTFHEAVLWGETGDPVGDRRLILGKIATYILNKWFKIQSSKICYVADQLEKTIRLPHHKLDFKYGTGEESNTKAILAFDSLAKKLRGMDLPLQIATIQSISEVLRHSLVFPPISRSTSKRTKGSTTCITLENSGGNCPYFRYAIEVQIFLEISGKWPEDLLAIKAMKLQFLIKMSSLLSNEGVTTVVFPSYLQVLWEGYVYHLKICYRREIYLLRLMKIGSPGIEKYVEEETEAALELEKEIEILPRLTSSINSIQSDHPSFSGSLRLIRRWLSSQLLVPHLPPVALDLLVAHLFISPSPYEAPNTPHLTLIRFMHLMATVDWKTTPVIVNLRNQLSDDDQREILKRFNNNRTCYPPLFICSPCELRPVADVANLSEKELQKRFCLLSCWSRPHPSYTILCRIKIVALSALDWYNKNMYSRNMEVLFKPSLDDYNVVIYLKRTALARRAESLFHEKPITIKPYKHITGERMPPVMFDPASYYLRDLRAAYDTLALFFHDDHGGDVIGVVWKPQALTQKPAKVSSLRGHRLSGVKQVMQVGNIEAYINDFQILGKGLIEKVVVQC